jgi:single-strand DNA-binding protein
MNINKVFVLGNLTRDPESRATPSGQQVATFGVATHRFLAKGEQESRKKVEFHPVVAWGHLGELCAKYLKKGQMVFVEGRLETGSWTTKDGARRTRTTIIAEDVQFGPRVKNGGGLSDPPYEAEEDQAADV